MAAVSQRKYSDDTESKHGLVLEDIWPTPLWVKDKAKSLSKKISALNIHGDFIHPLLKLEIKN